MSHHDLVVGLGEGEGRQRAHVVVGLRVEHCDGLGAHQVVQDEVVIFVPDGKVVLEFFGESSAEDAFAHGLVVVWVRAFLRNRWFRFFMLIIIEQTKEEHSPTATPTSI